MNKEINVDISTRQFLILCQDGIYHKNSVYELLRVLGNEPNYKNYPYDSNKNLLYCKFIFEFYTFSNLFGDHGIPKKLFKINTTIRVIIFINKLISKDYDKVIKIWKTFFENVYINSIPFVYIK